MDYLRKFDSRVPYVDKEGSSFKRPLVGVVLEIDGSKFYAPLSSPKLKHLTMKNSRDFIKIDRGHYGVINLNNMVPVLDQCVQQIDIANFPNSTKKDLDYVNLLSNQLTWCNSHKENIVAKATVLYDIIKNGHGNDNLRQRCCDFVLLVKKCKEYNK